MPGQRFLPLCLVVLALVLGACASEPKVKIGGHTVTVEVVTRPEDQALGLMFRDQMPLDHGMLFIYSSESMLSFWMKNTRIPLDILYFNAELELITLIHEAQPCRTPKCPSYPSQAPARYVLEVNGGLAREWQLALGDRLVLMLD